MQRLKLYWGLIVWAPRPCRIDPHLTSSRPLSSPTNMRARKALAERALKGEGAALVRTCTAMDCQCHPSLPHLRQQPTPLSGVRLLPSIGPGRTTGCTKAGEEWEAGKDCCRRAQKTGPASTPISHRMNH